MPTSPENLDNLVASGQAAALEDLATLCAVPSVSAKGQGLEPCADAVVDLMRRRGWNARVNALAGGPPIVFAEMRCSEPAAPTVLFYNHYDVQPAEPLELWDTDPFLLTIENGKAYARGAADDKGHIVSRLLAVDAVKEACGGQVPFHAKFLVEGEEEVGSPHLGVFVERHREALRADACIWEEGGENEQGNPTLYCGMRGIAYFELSVKTIAYDAHSGVGGSLLPNAAWRLVWALAALKDRHEHILLPGHYDHAIPASLDDLQLLSALPDNEAFFREEFGVPSGGFLGGPQTTGTEWRRRSVFEPTLTLCGIESGWQGPGAKTVLPSKARCKVDFRLVPDQDPDDVYDNLRHYLSSIGFADIQVRYLGGQKPARVDPGHPLVRLAAETGEEVYGKPAVIVPMVGGSGPMWWFTGFLGIPITSPGIEYPGVRVHAPNEHIRLDDFSRGTRHLARLLARIQEALPARKATRANPGHGGPK